MLIAALLALLPIAGCGSGGSSSSPSDSSAPPSPAAESTSSTTASKPAEPTLTKAQFIARSNVFCSNILHEINAKYPAYKHEKEAAGKPSSRIFALAGGDIILPGLLFWYDDINSLSRPKGDDKQIEALLTEGLQSTVEKALEHPYSFNSPAELAALYRRSNRLVRHYGITSCVVTKSSFSS